MRRRVQYHYGAPRCPVNPEHGSLFDVPYGSGRWFCPHEAHKVTTDGPVPSAIYILNEAGDPAPAH